MPFGRTAITGIELGPARLLAVEVRGRTPARVAAVDLPEEGALLAALRSAADEIPLRSGRVSLVTWDARQTHRTVRLPPMTAAERSQYLGREVGREAGEARAVGSRLLGQVQDGGRQHEVLVAATPREELDRALSAFAEARLIPRLVTTAPLALISAARALGVDLSQPTMLVHWGLSGLTMAVGVDGQLTFARQVPLLATTGLDPVDWVATEIDRSIRHYAVVSKGLRIERVGFASGEGARMALPASLGQLQSRLGLPVADIGEYLRPLLPEGAEEEWGLPAGAWLLAFGGARLRPREAATLLPPRLLVEARSRQVARAATAASVVLALVFVGGFWSTSLQAARIGQALNRERAAAQAARARLAEVDKVEAERAQARSWARLLSADPSGTPPIPDVLSEVSRLAPGRLQLERLAISRADAGYTMMLRGQVKDPDLAQAQLDFNRFYFGLRDSPLFYEVKLTRGGAAPAAAPPVPTRRATRPAEPEERPLEFELTLGLKEIT